jgi:hypothetical protein
MTTYYQVAVEYIDLDNQDKLDVECFCDPIEARRFAQNGGHQIPEVKYTGNYRINPLYRQLYKGIAEYFDPESIQFLEDTQCFCNEYDAIQFACNKGHQLPKVYYTGKTSVETITPSPPPSSRSRMIRASSSFQPPVPRPYPVPVPQTRRQNVCPVPPLSIIEQPLKALKNQRFGNLKNYWNGLELAIEDPDFIDRIKYKQANFKRLVDTPNFDLYLDQNPLILNEMNRCVNQLQYQNMDIATMINEEVRRNTSLPFYGRDPVKYIEIKSLIKDPKYFKLFMGCLHDIVVFNLIKLFLNTKLMIPLVDLESNLNNPMYPLKDVKINLKKLFDPLSRQIIFRDWESKQYTKTNTPLNLQHLIFRNRLYDYNTNIQNIYNIISVLNKRYPGGYANLIPQSTRDELISLLTNITNTLRNSPHYYGNI